jgi:hypothetical protein
MGISKPSPLTCNYGRDILADKSYLPQSHVKNDPKHSKGVTFSG